jgi:2-polyprenyl-3-methyl-5-hydroxy-6-metoxy-1,4-benzoquinol methylase
MLRFSHFIPEQGTNFLIMQELQTDHKLSTQGYWDDVLAAAQLPRVNTPAAYHHRVTMDFIDACLKGQPYSSFFEVGCGSSGWLPYFAQTYGYKVSGIDYSEVGCKLAEENLKLLSIPYGDIICRDIFEPDCTAGKKYDVVFSYGVIEHFDDPENIVRIFSSFLNEGGLMITLVPNLNGMMGALSRYFVKDIYKMHRVITARQLKNFHTNNGLQVVRAGYAGTFTLSVLPLTKSNRWLYKKGSFQRKITSFVLNTLNKVLTKFFTIFRINLPSQTFSPYAICIAKKETRDHV